MNSCLAKYLASNIREALKNSFIYTYNTRHNLQKVVQKS